MSTALGISFLLNVLAVVKLRVWNPGRNEPREQREGEEEAVVEQLIEISEVQVEEPVAVGAGVGGSYPDRPRSSLPCSEYPFLGPRRGR